MLTAGRDTFFRECQRLGLAKALLHTPRLLILDEPAMGLDPAGIVEIRNLLKELSQAQGVTVFMSSHILGEVARLADRIGIIHQGHLLREMDVTELERERRHRLVIQTRDSHATCAWLTSGGFSAELYPDHHIEIKDDPAIQHPEEVAAKLVHAGHPRPCSS